MSLPFFGHILGGSRLDVVFRVDLIDDLVEHFDIVFVLFAIRVYVVHDASVLYLEVGLSRGTMVLPVQTYSF